MLPFFIYYQVLSNTVRVGAFSNKVVFIGARYGIGFPGGVGTDNFRTPYSRWTGPVSPGVEIAATAYSNLARGDWLTVLPRVYELMIVVLLGALFGCGLIQLKPIPATAVAAASVLAIAGAAIILAWHKLFWFPWLIPVAVQIPAALFWSILAHTKRLQLEKETLEIQMAAAQFRPPLPELAGDERPTAPAGPSGLADGFSPPIPDHSLVRSIGKGAYGEVWLAKDVIGTYHAVKVIYRKSFKDAGPFEREFRGIQKFTPISRS